MLATRRHLKRALAALRTHKPLIAYVGAASGDNVGFYKMLAAAFVGTGAHLEMIRLVGKTAKVSVARRLLDDSDLVFLAGGDVAVGMRILDERGVADDLRRLSAAGKPFVGISAGSIMTGRHWVRFPDDDETRARPFACLGIAPLNMDAHSEDDNWPELRVLVRLLAKKDADALGYGVPSKGCLRVDLDGARPKLTALGAPVARVAAKAGRLVDLVPLQPAVSVRA
jgi:cyanophycinase-like exopeptidase